MQALRTRSDKAPVDITLGAPVGTSHASGLKCDPTAPTFISIAERQVTDAYATTGAMGACQGESGTTTMGARAVPVFVTDGAVDVTF
jgi:hypothetical protein